MRKWLYEWHDWGIYATVEVMVIAKDAKDPRYPNSKLAIVFSKNRNHGHPFKVDMERLFDTKEEAEEYGRKNCPSGAF